MRLALIIALVTATPLLADPALMTDAFGIAAKDDPLRNQWSGYRETMAGVGEFVAAGQGAAVQFYLGENSLVAGRGQGQAMALVTDHLGNLVANGTPVTITVNTTSAQASTQVGIASIAIGPFKKAGQFHAWAAVEGQQSVRAEYVVTPDRTSFAPVLERAANAALSEDFHPIETTKMFDPYGNPISDGTGLTVLIAGVDGSTSILPAITIGAVARAKILARDVAANGKMQMTIGRLTSAPQNLKIMALQPLGALQIKAVSMPDIAATQLHLGPFLTDGGHVLNDGATVAVTVITAQGKTQSLSGWVLDGAVLLTVLVDVPDFPISVQVTSPLGEITQIIDKQEPQP